MSIPELIENVKDVKISILKKNPPAYEVIAEGETNTLGWIDITLEDITPAPPPIPKGGVMELHLMGVPPMGGGSGDAFEHVTSKPFLIDPIPEWLTGVRVISKKNSIEEPAPK